MRNVRNAIHTMLILSMLSTGIPVHHHGDANHDDKVGLADVILRVRDLVNTDDQVAFRAGMENVLLSFFVVSGIKKVIKSDREPVIWEHPNIVPVSAICALQNLPLMPVGKFLSAEHKHIYDSPPITPLTPPPLFSRA